MPAKIHVVKVVFLVLCLSMLALQNGCSNSGSGNNAQAPASDGNAIHLSLSTTTGFMAVVADGRSTIPIRMQVTNGSGAGMSGVSVTFATTAGTLSEAPVVRATRDVLSADQANQIVAPRADGNGSVTVTTDANGIAQVLLTASTRVETAVVTADALGFRTNIVINFVPDAPARVQLSASPTTVNAGSTSTFTATVTDANGNPVSGETVTFTLSTNMSGATLSSMSGTTNSNGQATVTYTAGSTPGADTVRALATSSGVSGSTSVKVTVPAIAGVARIDLLVSSPQLGSAGTGNVMLTALVRDAANNVVSGIPVNFTADSGSIQVTNKTTGANGTATALLTTGGDPKNRTITVKATIGNLSSTNTVLVSGTTLSVSGASTLVLGATTQLSILLHDSGGSGIPNQPITVSSALGNTLSATTVTTDATGQSIVDVTARVPGNDTIQVSVLGATATVMLTVNAANFAFTAPAASAQVLLNASQPVTVHWDEAGVNQVGRTINFFATRGTLSPPSAPPTDANGNTTVTISSPQAGPAVINANVTGGPSSQVSIEFFATTPSALVLHAVPTTLGVNAPGSTTQQSVITATVQDMAGNLVKNRMVSFSLRDTIGGSVFPASAVTDSFGRASTVYTAGAVPSAKDGVVITAVVDCPLLLPPLPPTCTATVQLTVAQQALFVTLGTGNLIQTPSNTQYAQPYSVIVTDANGNPVGNVPIELSVLPTQYQKGMYICTGSWFKAPTTISPCLNEDLNLNGVLDKIPLNEDLNGNDRLDPGNVATTVPGRVVTNATGFAFFDVVYAREFTWVEVALQARTTVVGSESLSRVVFFLPGLASDFSNCNVSPPGVVSPYGMAATCGDPK